MNAWLWVCICSHVHADVTAEHQRRRARRDACSFQYLVARVPGCDAMFFTSLLSFVCVFGCLDLF